MTPLQYKECALYLMYDVFFIFIKTRSAIEGTQCACPLVVTKSFPTYTLVNKP